VTISSERIERVQSMLTRRLGTVVVVLEAVHRRHNTSAILRSCECFGVHEVHLITHGFRPSKGAARGSERWLDIRHWESTERAVSALHERGFKIFVADLVDDAHSPDTVPVDVPVAVLMGAELTGVSDQARALADGAICVPMRGLTESLNVSVAAACILQRVTERRRLVTGGGDLGAERQATFLAEWEARELASRQGMIGRSRLNRS
jgi:tRNA (guanosine-2'-O-)-methyltransferase